MSIRSRLLLLMLLAISVPMALEIARFFQDRQETIDRDTGQLVRIAQDRAEELADRIQGTEQLLFGLAQAPVLSSGDRERCSAFLSDVRERYPQYTGILTITPEGQLFCDSLQTGRELDLRDRAYFQEALVSTGRVALQPAFGRLTGVAVLQIAFPARDADGKLLFVLLASLDLRQIAAMENPGVPGANVVLVDHSGVVLAASREGDDVGPLGESIAESELFRFAATPHETTEEVRAPGGERGIWATANGSELAAAQIHVLAGAPRDRIVASANERFLTDLLLLGLAALALFLFVGMLAELAIRRQIARISKMAEQLAGGDLSARIEPPLPRGELGALMGVMNSTAQSLEQRRADIEELNERLRQSQRMESLGQLTGGVAHDFNNLLTVVMGNAELLAESAEPDSAEQQMAEMISDAARRGAELTQSLLAFARRQALNPRPVDVNQMVASMDLMLRRSLGEHVEIELIRAAGLWPALVDQGQLENAVLNLCLNARDAMPEGGRLTIETANTRIDAEYAARHAEVEPGAYVMLAVSDTGEGIPPERLERIFEPFFTTKEKGKGTGLGLAMVYGFVKQSGGHVGVYSEVGSGTTVKLYLPRAVTPAEAPSGQGGDVPMGGTETILLVEDDPGVRSYAVEQLRQLGYRVIEAKNGEQALAVLREGEQVDLLFTDVVMPGMNGNELAERARELRPGMRVLYTSGYAENAIVHQGRLDPGAQLLNKPYRRAELDRAIRAALSR